MESHHKHGFCRAIIKIIEIEDNKINVRFSVPILQNNLFSKEGYKIISKKPLILSNGVCFVWIKKLPINDYIMMLFILSNFEDEKSYCKLIIQQYFKNKAVNLNLFN